MRVRVALAVLVLTLPARALDKQGSAHGGSVEGPTEGFGISGSAGGGVAIYNRTYAARPNNSGLALFRAVGHLDIDLIGTRLAIPLDVNLFTDREARPGARWLAPSEIDLIGGLTSTWRLGPGALEGGARVEWDSGLDPGGTAAGRAPRRSQLYGDVRMRYLMSLAASAPDAAAKLANGDVSGWLTLGWFAVNPGYFARPDNTGLALLRYGLHTELSVWEKRLGFGVDGTMFTDGHSHALVPSELDLTLSLIGRFIGAEFQIAYERDMPVDRGGLVQDFVYALATVPFEIVKHPESAEN